MLFQDETWKWLEAKMTTDLAATTNRLYNSSASLEDMRKLQGRIELIRTLLNSPQATQLDAQTRK